MTRMNKRENIIRRKERECLISIPELLSLSLLLLVLLFYPSLDSIWLFFWWWSWREAWQRLRYDCKDHVKSIVVSASRTDMMMMNKTIQEKGQKDLQAWVTLTQNPDFDIYHEGSVCTVFTKNIFRFVTNNGMRRRDCLDSLVLLSKDFSVETFLILILLEGFLAGSKMCLPFPFIPLFDASFAYAWHTLHLVLLPWEKFVLSPQVSSLFSCLIQHFPFILFYSLNHEKK